MQVDRNLRFRIARMTAFVLGVAAVTIALTAQHRANNVCNMGYELSTHESEISAVKLKHPLAGTTWRLVEIQSMDDTIGTVKPDDPSLYTMRLNADRTVHIRLNCNRANGNWSAEPGDDPNSGRFEFGPVAATRALCPPPSLDERIASDTRFVRSYLLSEGRLYLSLMADGGIYVWEPQPDELFQTKPDGNLEAAIVQVSPGYTRQIVEVGGGRLARYIYGQVDLNNDGRNEVLVYLLGSIFCGTGGCDLLLFKATDEGFSLINRFPISRLPVIVTDDRSNGWSDLVRLESGGGVEPSYVRHIFDGKHYVKQERMLSNTAPAGRKYLAGDFTFQDGIPLEPPE